jgi:hypothetical protein
MGVLLKCGVEAMNDVGFPGVQLDARALLPRGDSGGADGVVGALTVERLEDPIQAAKRLRKLGRRELRGDACRRRAALG